MTTSRALAGTVLAIVLLAGCSKAAQPTAAGPATTPPSSNPVTVSSGPVSMTSSQPAPPPSSTASTSRPASSSAARPTPATSTSTVPIDGPGGCPTSSLKVMALRASGAAGHQYAFLQFTNTSATSCSLTGFPGVQLIRAGQLIGQPAARSGAQPARVRIAPGASVQARLIDDSTCNADNSDSVQVIPPNRTDRIVLPLSLRGCPLHIDPVINA